MHVQRSYYEGVKRLGSASGSRPSCPLAPFAVQTFAPFAPFAVQTAMRLRDLDDEAANRLDHEGRE